MSDPRSDTCSFTLRSQPPCCKEIQNSYLGWNRSPAQVGCMRQRLDLGDWEDLEGSGREGGGRGDQDAEHMQTHGCFISMYDKIHYNKKIIIIKKKKFRTDYQIMRGREKSKAYKLGGLPGHCSHVTCAQLTWNRYTQLSSGNLIFMKNSPVT